MSSAPDAHGTGTSAASAPKARILIYSDDVTTRDAVKLAIGRRPSPESPMVEFIECATPPAVITAVDKGGLDVLVLDGEATPAGGMGVARQVKDEIYRCPPVLVLLGRPQDAWLASWSRADAVVSYPLDPMQIAEAVASLLRQRLAGVPST